MHSNGAGQRLSTGSATAGFKVNAYTLDNSIQPSGNGGEMRTQLGALCWRMQDGQPEVLLVTSRDTGRWVIPKGWPMTGITAPAAAAREAWEEAGVEGRVDPLCLGYYSYEKVLGRRRKAGPDALPSVICLVAVYPVQVEQLQDVFPEMHQRRRKWFSPAKAARKVYERELQALLRDTGQLLISHGLIDLPVSDGRAPKA